MIFAQFVANRQNITKQKSHQWQKRTHTDVQEVLGEVAQLSELVLAIRELHESLEFLIPITLLLQTRQDFVGFEKNNI